MSNYGQVALGQGATQKQPTRDDNRPYLLSLCYENMKQCQGKLIVELDFRFGNSSHASTTLAPINTATMNETIINVIKPKQSD